MVDEGALRSLLLRSLAGDQTAHGSFLREAAAMLPPFFRAHLPEGAGDVEELVQDTLLALHTRRKSYDLRYPPSAWVFAIARYRLMESQRRAKRGAHERDLQLCRWR